MFLPLHIHIFRTQLFFVIEKYFLSRFRGNLSLTTPSCSFSTFVLLLQHYNPNPPNFKHVDAKDEERNFYFRIFLNHDFWLLRYFTFIVPNGIKTWQIHRHIHTHHNNDVNNPILKKWKYFLFLHICFTTDPICCTFLGISKQQPILHL